MYKYVLLGARESTCTCMYCIKYTHTLYMAQGHGIKYSTRTEQNSICVRRPQVFPIHVGDKSSRCFSYPTTSWSGLSAVLTFLNNLYYKISGACVCVLDGCDVTMFT